MLCALFEKDIYLKKSCFVFCQEDISLKRSCLAVGHNVHSMILDLHQNWILELDVPMSRF